MKTLLNLSLFLLLSSNILFSQDESNLGVFKSDTTWLKEIIKFPLSFAPEIKHEGYEDLRFAKQWRNKDHEDFWCYTFAWQITNGFETQTIKSLEHSLKLYYDGLMKVVNKQKDFEVPQTKVELIKKENNSEVDFIGKIVMHDSFNTEAMITLNVLIKGYYCKEKEMSTIIFRLSPKDFNHSIWKRYKKDINLTTNACFK